MNKIVKWILGLGALLGVLLIALVVLVKTLVTPERVKELVIPLAEAKLQRQVTLGAVEIGLLSGIELHDLAIAEKAGNGRLLSVDLARLRFQWLPLLARRVIIDEVLLERPKVQVSRDAAGNYSIADLLTVAAAGKADAGGARAADTPISLLVSDLSVTGGEALFIDHFIDPDRPVRLALTGLEMSSAGFVLDGNLPVKLKGAVNGAPLEISGTLRLLEKGGRFLVELTGLDVLPLAPYFREKLPGRLDALTIDLKAEVERTQSGTSAKGSAIWKNLTLQLAAFPEAPLRGATAKTDFDLAFEPEAGKLELKSFALDFNGLAANASGRLTGLDGKGVQADLRLTIPGIDLRKAMSALPAGLLGKAAAFAPSGVVRAEIVLQGKVDQPLALVREGTVTLEQVQGDVAGLRPAINGRLILSDGAARIERLTAGVGEVAAEVSGAITGLFTRPVANLTVTLPRTDLGPALAKVPPELLRGVAKLSPTGQVEGRARLSGPLAEPKALLKSAEVVMTAVKVSAGGQHPEVNGRLKLAGDRLDTDGLNVRLGETTARLAGSVRNLFGKPLVATLDVSADRFPLESLLQGGGATAVATGKGPAPAAPAGEIGPFDLALEAGGTIRIGETTWKGLAVKNFLADYDLRDNRLNIRRMTGNVAGGSFSNTARVDLTQPGLAYEAGINLKGVEMQSLLPALEPAAANSLYGRLDLNGQITGRGTQWANISRSLSGDMVLSLADGKLTSPELVKGFADFLQLADFNEIVFREFSGKARLVNGKADIDAVLTSNRIKLAPQGTVGLDGSLNVAMDTRLSPEAAARIDQRGKVTRYLTDAEGWTQVPLLISGTVKAPRYGLDPKGVRAQTGRIIEKELQRGLDKLLNKPKAQEPPADGGTAPGGDGAGSGGSSAPQPATPAQQLLDESLKRLFKKQ